jgi:hypothetical protein
MKIGAQQDLTIALLHRQVFGDGRFLGSGPGQSRPWEHVHKSVAQKPASAAIAVQASGGCACYELSCVPTCDGPGEAVKAEAAPDYQAARDHREVTSPPQPCDDPAPTAPVPVAFYYVIGTYGLVSTGLLLDVMA